MVNKFIKRIIKYTIIAIIFLAILYNFMNINNSNEGTKIFKYSIMVVEEYQEQDGIRKNTLIIAKDIKTKYNINDLVMVNINNTTYIHRIIDIKGKEFITKGDGNYKINEKIAEEQIIGKVVKKVPYIGVVFRFVRTRIFSILIILFLIVTLMYNKHIYIKKKIRRKKQKHQK